MISQSYEFLRICTLADTLCCDEQFIRQCSLSVTEGGNQAPVIRDKKTSVEILWISCRDSVEIL